MKNATIVKLSLLALTVLLLGGILAACAPPPLPETPAAPPEAKASTLPEESPMPDLTNSSWQLTDYVDAEGHTQSALPDAPAFITFEDGQFSASTGCNGLSGSYEVDGQQISFQLGPMTMRACSEPQADQESGFLNGLHKAARYELKAGGLTLMDADGNQLLTFSEREPITLVGSSWQLLRFNNGKNGMESNLTTEKITLVFGEDGKVSGNAGCNNFNGGYEVDGDKLTVGPLATTRKMCAEPEGVMETESIFLENLSAAASYAIQDDETLVIFDSEGTKLLVFTPAKQISLTDTPWQLLSFNNGKGGMVSNLATSKITAVFDQDGMVLGNAGCNDYNGSYEIDGDKLTVGPLATTRKMCDEPQDVMETEQAFLKNLESAATFTIEEKTLTIFGSDGTKLLVFVPGS